MLVDVVVEEEEEDLVRINPRSSEVEEGGVEDLRHSSNDEVVVVVDLSRPW